MLCGFILPWSKPLRELPTLLTRHMEKGLTYGESEYGSYMASHKIKVLFYQGTPLATVQQELLPVLQFVQNTKSLIAINAIQTVQRVIANLKAETQNELKFDINAVDDNKFEEQCRQKNSFYALCLYHIQKAFVLYLYGHFEKALSSLTLAKKSLIFILF